MSGTLQKEGEHGTYDMQKTQPELVVTTRDGSHTCMAKAPREVSLEYELKINQLRQNTGDVHWRHIGTIEIEGEEIKNTGKVKFIRSTVTYYLIHVYTKETT